MRLSSQGCCELPTRLEELIRDKLNKLQRKGVVALVTQDVHNRDIIQELFDNKITSMQNFKWQQQLRHSSFTVESC